MAKKDQLNANNKKIYPETIFDNIIRSKADKTTLTTVLANLSEDIQSMDDAIKDIKSIEFTNSDLFPKVTKAYDTVYMRSRCSGSVQDGYQLITMANNAGNLYGYAVFQVLDGESVTYNSKYRNDPTTISGDIKFKMDKGRYHISLGNRQIANPGTSNGATYDPANVAVYFGTIDGQFIQVNGTRTSVSYSADKYYTVHFECDMINHKASLYFYDDQNELILEKTKLDFVDSNVNNLCLVGVYSYTPCTIAIQENFSFTYDFGLKDGVLYMENQLHSLRYYMYDSATNTIKDVTPKEQVLKYDYYNTEYKPNDSQVTKTFGVWVVSRTKSDSTIEGQWPEDCPNPFSGWILTIPSPSDTTQYLCDESLQNIWYRHYLTYPVGDEQEAWHKAGPKLSDIPVITISGEADIAGYLPDNGCILLWEQDIRSTTGFADTQQPISFIQANNSDDGCYTIANGSIVANIPYLVEVVSHPYLEGGTTWMRGEVKVKSLLPESNFQVLRELYDQVIQGPDRRSMQPYKIGTWINGDTIYRMDFAIQLNDSNRAENVEYDDANNCWAAYVSMPSRFVGSGNDMGAWCPLNASCVVTICSPNDYCMVDDVIMNLDAQYSGVSTVGFSNHVTPKVYPSMAQCEGLVGFVEFISKL